MSVMSRVPFTSFTVTLSHPSHPSRLIRPKAGPCGTEMRRGKDGEEKGIIVTGSYHSVTEVVSLPLSPHYFRSQ